MTRPCVFVATAVALLLAGCSTLSPPRIHPRATTPQAQTVAVAVPEISVRRLGVASSSVEEEWTRFARQIVREELEAALVASGATAVPLDLAWREGALSEPAIVLDAIAGALAECLPEYARACRDVFDHGVGSLDAVLPPHVDALLVVLGSNEVSTRGRVAVNTALGTVASVIVLPLAILTAGHAIRLIPLMMLRYSETHVSAALIGRDGTLLWWRTVDAEACCDLRKDSGRGTIRHLVEGLPAGLGGSTNDIHHHVTHDDAAP